MMMKKRVAILASVLLTLFAAVCCASGGAIRAAEPTLAELFNAAVEDAKIAEEDEIRPLVTLARDDAMTEWNDKGQVKLYVLHNYPDSYIQGQDYVTSYGEVWVFSGRELVEWFKTNDENADDWNMRLKQLLGCPYEKDYGYFSAMWVTPADVKRPAYEPDPTKQISALELPVDVDPSFAEWFAKNEIYSYETSAQPWTRLGYTYDWARYGKEYGLTEFLIKKDATVFVEKTDTVDALIEWLKQTKQPPAGSGGCDSSGSGIGLVGLLVLSLRARARWFCWPESPPRGERENRARS
ncbi:MAG: hypothetical protein LBQ42_13130 [Synergistaceae bacterium]|jgi:hypothetical protein|nr:hypothetical protein [Synergistaceae bacterium]